MLNFRGVKEGNQWVLDLFKVIVYGFYHDKSPSWPTIWEAIFCYWLTLRILTPQNWLFWGPKHPCLIQVVIERWIFLTRLPSSVKSIILLKQKGRWKLDLSNKQRMWMQMQTSLGLSDASWVECTSSRLSLQLLICGILSFDIFRQIWTLLSLEAILANWRVQGFLGQHFKGTSKEWNLRSFQNQLLAAASLTIGSSLGWFLKARSIIFLGARNKNYTPPETNVAPENRPPQ